MENHNNALKKIENLEINNKDSENITLEKSFINEEISDPTFDNNILKLFNVFKLGKDFLDLIDLNKEYVVKFPAELLKKMSENDIQFLEDSITGDLLPTLYDYTEKGFAGSVRLVLKKSIKPEALNQLGNSLNHIADQVRYEKLMEQIADLQKTTKNIQRGQDLDRFAHINAAKEHIKNMELTNSENIKNNFLDKAINELTIGREEIKNQLKHKLDQLPLIEDNEKSRFFYVLRKGRGGGRQSYRDIQEYFYYYYEALKLSAYSYMRLNETQLIENLVSNYNDVFTPHRLEKLKNIEYILPEGELMDNMWYESQKFLDNILIKSFNRDSISEFEYIKLPGSKLFEMNKLEEEDEQG